MASSVEFVRIAGYPVKVTSVARDESTGSIALVVITRGSADRNHLNDLLATSPLTLEVPEEPSKAVRVEGVDARSVGEGEQAITRFSIRFGPVDPAQAAAVDEPNGRSIEERLETIERKLDRVLDVLTSRRSPAPMDRP